ncbi:MAG: AMP-binding protein [Deltaproteobacteria bacterium]|nr:AMP-binding protein [Deltaproteobacteria bacterium]
MAAKTLFTFLEQQAERRAQSTAVFFRRGDTWQSLSWEQLARDVRELAVGLLTLDLKPGDRVALIAPSCVEWLVIDLALASCGARPVAIPARFPIAEWPTLIERTGAALAVVADAAAAAALEERRALLPSLRAILTLDPAPTAAATSGVGIERLTCDQLRTRGRSAQGARGGMLIALREAIADEDVACLHYTLGTMERAKCVAIAHDALHYQVEALARLDLVKANDLVLLCIPLAHVYGRVMAGLWLRLGHALALADSPDELLEVVGALQPTIVVAPPRVFELLYGTIVRSGRDGRGPRSAMFAWAMGQARARMDRERAGRRLRGLGWSIARHAVFNLVADRLRRLFGGRVRLFVTGPGPLAERVAQFFRYSDIEIRRSYGLTESCGISCIEGAGAGKIGSSGRPLPGTEVRIADDGEILLRGRGLMKCYWDYPEHGLAVDGDGFLHTGDIGELDRDGDLTVHGRKEDLIRMRDGTVVEPHLLEAALRANAFIAHVLVDGTGGRELIALVTLDRDTIASWARARRLPVHEPSQLVHAPEVRRLIQSVIDDRNRKHPPGLGIKRFAIVDHPFTIGDELTETMRLRRERVRQKYRVTIDALHGVDDPGDA